ncbi:class I SAM-dependent methyltransferase [Aurantibacillus circumpalustris]|uniref:class I SAM-dependent methyltransferase n=1 Tax=Aurantibacillus circumpalustris TaxID=3036359 RepID=UPI00295C25A7|nr:class I SAM-dependent methyltransferase [Aurantibacillus circumpalustris]
MKIVIYLYYFFRSVFLRGLYNTIQLLRAEQVNERFFGIKTSRIKKSNSKEFFHYQGASYKVLFRIFSEIKDINNLEFVDIGSGKGRAVFMAEYNGFNYVSGIEMDEVLVSDSKNNVARYLKKRKESQIAFIQSNALDYEYKNAPSVYFLFNPFNEEILKKVLDRILSSTFAETWFIYMNPLYSEAFRREGIELVRTFKTRFYTEALLFKIKGKTE